MYRQKHSTTTQPSLCPPASPELPKIWLSCLLRVQCRPGSGRGLPGGPGSSRDPPGPTPCWVGVGPPPRTPPGRGGAPGSPRHGDTAAVTSPRPPCRPRCHAPALLRCHTTRGTSWSYDTCHQALRGQGQGPDPTLSPPTSPGCPQATQHPLLCPPATGGDCHPQDSTW